MKESINRFYFFSQSFVLQISASLHLPHLFYIWVLRVIDFVKLEAIENLWMRERETWSWENFISRGKHLKEERELDMREREKEAWRDKRYRNWERAWERETNRDKFYHVYMQSMIKIRGIWRDDNLLENVRLNFSPHSVLRFSLLRILGCIWVILLLESIKLCLVNVMGYDELIWVMNSNK